MTKPEVVISGIGATFPQSTSVQDFGSDLLANKHLPTPTSRWKYDNELEVEPVCGQTPFEQFDEVFYGMSRSLSRNTDPVSKVGYERSFEAIIDAGLHPFAMRGANVAVFVGSGVNEFEQRLMYMQGSLLKCDGYTVMGIARGMFANRISYYFDFKGPSFTSDSSWGAIHLQLQQAANYIRSGQSDAAMVVACNITMFPESSALLRKLGFISNDGQTRCFDENASGSIRSDSCIAFFLQRADQAKRCYAKVVASDLQFVGTGSTADGTMPNPRAMESFLTNFYRSNSIDPKRIVYLEADGSAHPIRDECELRAIDSALIKNSERDTPLLLGSVKSNLGHTDCVSGYAAVCKAIVAMETGTIPATINFDKLNAKLESAVEGRIRVVDTNTPLKLSEDSVLAINTLGLIGTIGHTVLQANSREPQPPQNPEEHLPRLITLSGRTEEAIKEVVKKVREATFDTNYYRLVQDTFSPNIRGYNFRSYVVCPAKEHDNSPVMRMEPRTVWFVYSGMGSQWAGMGAALMAIPIFAETIDRLHAVLATKGMDLKTILTETGPKAFDNILKSFVGITACQIALTNVLTAVNVKPDGIVGHSVGEVACAYIDGCLTEEQAILTAWARGIASNQAPLIKGMMAAVGLGHKDVLPRLPPTVDVACHNSDSSCTLSGPVEDVQRFVQQLSDEGVFARAVNVSDIAYHSRYIQPAAPFLRKQLQEVITVPKQRSAKWVTTSVPLDQRAGDLSKFCSVEYQTNNLLSPVLFEEALQHIAQTSMVIEIAPHGLLQAILKRALPHNHHVALAQRGNSDPVRFLLHAIGKASLGSAAPNTAALYPDVQFPVPRGTGSLATLVSWDWAERGVDVVFKDSNDRIRGIQQLTNDTPALKVNGIKVLALSELLNLMWTRHAVEVSQPISALPVTFRNVHVDVWKKTSEGGNMLYANYLPASSNIIIIDAFHRVLLRGSVGDANGDDWEQPKALPVLQLDSKDTITLSKEEIYQEFQTFGVEFSKNDQNITSIKIYEQDWIFTVAYSGRPRNLLESVLQIHLLKDLDEVQELRLPRTIQRFDIDLSKIKNNSNILLRLNFAANVVVGDGVYAFGFRSTHCPAELQSETRPEALQLASFGVTEYQSKEEFLRVVLGNVLEQRKTTNKDNLAIMNISIEKKTRRLAQTVAACCRLLTGTQPVLVTLPSEGTAPRDIQGAVLLLVAGQETLPEAVRSLVDGCADALLVRSNGRLSEQQSIPLIASTAVVVEQRFGSDWISLVRCAASLTSDDTVVVQVVPTALPPTRIPDSSAVVVLVWRGLGEEDIEAAVAEVNSRPYASRARMVFVLDNAAPSFSLAEPLYAHQLARGSRVNVLAKDCSWTCKRTLPIPAAYGALLSVSRVDDLKLEFISVNPLSRSRQAGHVDLVGLNGQGIRVMGIGQWLADHRHPRIDPVLRWDVPDKWSARDAVTVPYVYAAVYHALKVKAKARPGESVLVQDGTSAIGQAAIRVATELGCSPIYITAREGKEVELLKRIFPQIEPRCIFHRGDGGSFEIRLRQMTYSPLYLERGVRLVVNTLPGDEMRAAFRSLGFWGRILNFSQEDMENASTIGTSIFMNSVYLFGFSGNELFRSNDRDRAEVAESVRKGLHNGTVQPIVGAEVFNSVPGATSFKDCRKAVIEVNSAGSPARQQCDPNKCYIVVGHRIGDALLVASRLAMLGAHHILAAVGASANGAYAQQRQCVLRRQHGTNLHVMQIAVWDTAAVESVVKAASGLAPLHTAVAIARGERSANVLRLIGDALSAVPGVALVVLMDKPTSEVAALTQRRSGSTTSMALGAGVPLTAGLDHLADMLAGGFPEVSVLPTTNTVEGVTATQQSYNFLEVSSSTLSDLGRGATGSADALSFLEIPTLGLPARFPRENQPLYVLPPLGVLDGASRKQLTGLAARLFNPMLVVETSAPSSITEAAKAVVKAILERQPCGPFNVMGWSLGTVLALEVQRQLESAGKRGVLFLVQGDVVAARQWAQACPAQQLLADAKRGVIEDAMERRGAEVVTCLLDAIAKHKSNVESPFDWLVNVIRCSVDEPHFMDVNDSHIQVKTIPHPDLDNTAFVSFMNENTAYSQLAGNDDLRLSIALQG